MSGIASAAASATAPAAIAWPPRSVAGHPTPATVTAAAPSGRRAATKSAIGSHETEDRAEDERVHLRVLAQARRAGRPRRSRRSRAPRRPAPVRGRARRGTARAPTAPRRRRSRQRRAPRRRQPPTRDRSGPHERGDDRERGDGQTLSDEPRILQAQPGRRDGECRKQRCEERPTHEPPPRTTAPTSTVARSSPLPDHRGRDTVGGEAEQAGLGACRARCEARRVDPDDRDEASRGAARAPRRTPPHPSSPSPPSSSPLAAQE